MAIVSKLSQIILGLPANFKMKTDNIPTYLKKQGVKEEELEFSGFNTALKSDWSDKPDTLDKEGLSSYLGGRDDQFEMDKRLGAPHQDDWTEDSSQFPETSLVPDSEDYFENIRTYIDKSGKQPIWEGDDFHFGHPGYLSHTRGRNSELDGQPTKILEEVQSDAFQDRSEEARNLQLPTRKTSTRKGIEYELNDAIESNQRLAIPLSSADPSNLQSLSRSKGVQAQLYEKTIPSTMKKIAKQNLLDYTEKVDADGINYGILTPNKNTKKDFDLYDIAGLTGAGGMAALALQSPEAEANVGARVVGDQVSDEELSEFDQMLLRGRDNVMGLQKKYPGLEYALPLEGIASLMGKHAFGTPRTFKDYFEANPF